MKRHIIGFFLALLAVGSLAPRLEAGPDIVQGPPWHTSYKTARREALRSGKPVFIYYTKFY